MGLSSQLASKYPEVPPCVYYCYTKVSGFRLIPLHFGFSSIFYDFAISQEFLIKKREEDPQIFFLIIDSLDTKLVGTSRFYTEKRCIHDQKWP